MPPITALLHTTNDAPRLGRTLEMLLPCAELLIVDHHSADSTCRIARGYGARILDPADVSAASQYLASARHDWILCMSPGESITESLQAGLYEWAALSAADVHARSVSAFSVRVRQQSGSLWSELSQPETRLIPRTWLRWDGVLPAADAFAVPLEGEVLRFDLP